MKTVFETGFFILILCWQWIRECPTTIQTTTTTTDDKKQIYAIYMIKRPVQTVQMKPKQTKKKRKQNKNDNMNR